MPKAGEVCSGSGRGIQVVRRGIQVSGEGIQVSGEGIQGVFEGIRMSVRVFSHMAMQRNAFFPNPNASEGGLEFPQYNIMMVEERDAGGAKTERRGTQCCRAISRILRSAF